MGQSNVKDLRVTKRIYQSAVLESVELKVNKSGFYVSYWDGKQLSQQIIADRPLQVASRWHHVRSKTDHRFEPRSGVTLLIGDGEDQTLEVVPHSETVENGKLYGKLLNLGVSVYSLWKLYDKIPPITLIREYVNTVRPELKEAVYPRNGWNDEKTHFIAGSEAIPAKVGVRGCFSKLPAFCNPPKKLADWQRQVAQPIKDHPAYAWVLTLPFATCLLPFVDMPKNAMGGFHLFGNSSTGKTNALRLASTVFGDDIQGWDTTANSLEIVASDHHHRLLCLDELGQAKNDQVVLDAAYKLSQCKGKSRTDQNLSTPRPFTFDLFFLSTGEQSFEDLVIRATGEAPYAGQKIRFCDIAYTEKLNPSLPVAIDEFEQSMALCRGSAGRAFIEKLASTSDEERKEIANEFLAIRKKLWKNEADGKIRRVANRFALCILGASLAKRWGILPSDWDEYEAPTTVFNSWKGSNKAIDEGVEVAKNLMDFVSSARASGRFHIFKPSGDLSFQAFNNVSGFLRDSDEVVFLLPKAFKEAVGVKSPTIAKKFLKEEEIIFFDEARRTYNVRMQNIRAKGEDSGLVASSKTVAIQISLEKLKSYLERKTEASQIARPALLIDKKITQQERLERSKK